MWQVRWHQEAFQVVSEVLLRLEIRFCSATDTRTDAGIPTLKTFPGGHVDANEIPRDALVRELREELGIVAAAPIEPIAHIQGADFRNDIWLIDAWTGEPANRAPGEHDEVKGGLNRLKPRSTDGLEGLSVP